MVGGRKYVILLDGPVGAGKSTLGRGLAPEIGAGFIDGDDYADPDRPWYATALTTSRSIVAAARNVLDDHGAAVIAYPVNCVGWIYFRRRFAELSARTILIGLAADYASIIGRERGREFDAAERARIKVMIREGYGQRPFSDHILATNRVGISDTLRELAGATQRIIR